MDEAVTKMRATLAANRSRVRDLFREWDVDGDGTIGKDELALALSKLGYSDLSPKTIDVIFGLFDTGGNGDGRIDYEEMYGQVRRWQAAGAAIDAYYVRLYSVAPLEA